MNNNYFAGLGQVNMTKGRYNDEVNRKRMEGTSKYIWYIKTPENKIEKVSSLKYWCLDKKTSYHSMRIIFLKYGKNKGYVLLKKVLL